eukprot:2225527-Amphidinium_carterae.1
MKKFLPKKFGALSCFLGLELSRKIDPARSAPRPLLKKKPFIDRTRTEEKQRTVGPKGIQHKEIKSLKYDKRNLTTLSS